MPFCTQCGHTVMPDHRFCAECGAPVQRAETAPVIMPRAPRLPGDAPVAVGASFLSSSNPPAEPPDMGDDPTRRNLLGLAGVLALIVLSGLVGYLLVGRNAAPDPATAVEATEGVIDSRAGRSAPEAGAHEERADGLRWTVVGEATRETASPDFALGAPDGKVAVIPPGGSLALGLDGGAYFYNGPGADIDVHGVGGGAYTIFARAEAVSAWLRFDINRRGFANGAAAHDMGHHGIGRARHIMIRNIGAGDLSIDAVTVGHTAPEDGHSDKEAGHREPHD